MIWYLRARAFVRRWSGALAFAAACLTIASLPAVRRFAVFPDERVAEDSWLARAFDPLARAAAAIQWTRVDHALRHGETSRAYAMADTALRIDPRSPHGWIFLARHFVLERASPERGEDAHARAMWVRAGLDLLERGERASRDPGALAFERAAVYAYFASADEPAIVDVATSREAWELAALSFERAQSLGVHDAVEAALVCRERALASPR